MKACGAGQIKYLEDCQMKALDAAKRGKVDEAWGYIYTIREHCLEYASLSELKGWARTLRAEVADEGRFPPWRCQAINEILQQSEHWDEETARSHLWLAMRLRNAGEANQYFRLEITRHYQRVLLCFGIPLMVAAIYLLSVSAQEITKANWVLTSQSVILCALLGALGAATSAGQRSTKIGSEHVFSQLGSSVASLSRIPIGVVAGLSVWLFTVATSGASQIVSANMLLAAFGAGFAERLAVLQTAPDETNMRNGKGFPL
jgi:hypothetical protein